MAKQGNRKGSSEAAAERRYKALRMRASGKSYRDIGKVLDISNVQAYRDVCDALAENIERHESDIKKMREIESERLDRIWQRLWATIIYEENGRKCLNYDSIDRLIRLSERRSKLLGIDRPTKIDLDVTDWRKQAELIGVEAKEAEDVFSQLVNEIARRSAQPNDVGSSKGGKEVKQSRRALLQI